MGRYYSYFIKNKYVFQFLQKNLDIYRFYGVMVNFMLIWKLPKK